MSKEGRKIEEKMNTGKVGDLLAKVRVKLVNVFMEKWGLIIWPNQGLGGNFMGDG